MKINVVSTLHAATSSVVEIDFKWEDVKEWWVKWDTLYCVLKGEEEAREIELGSCTEDVVEWKYPLGVKVFKTSGELLADDGE